MKRRSDRMSARELNTLDLSDGRRLGYAEYGETVGKPIFLFHGFPGCRLMGRAYDETAKKFGVRLISLDRPGVGLSDYKWGRKYRDWPPDVVEVADKLGMERFGILAVSGGGPYGAVCAAKIPDRLTGVALVCSVAPKEHEKNPRKTGLNSWMIRSRHSKRMSDLRRDPDRFISLMAENLPPADREALVNTEIGDVLVDEMLEACRLGTRGVAREEVLAERDWGFNLDAIPIEVGLWHGEQDANAPVDGARYLARSIPMCKARFYANEGHFSLIANRRDEVMKYLAEEN